MSQDKIKSTKFLTRNSVLEEARSWLGAPFRHQGRNRAHGVDCVGLAIMVQKAHDPDWDHDITNYRREPDQGYFLSLFRELMVEKPIADRLPGDILLMRDRRFTCHCVFYDVKSGTEFIVHSYALRRKVVEEQLSTEWRNNTTHCFEFKGITD